MQGKIIQASRWSFKTELLAKLVTPAANMILARVLVPEAFGVVATITMVISFAEMLSDAGFQRYIVQHDFCDDDDKRRQFLVAFWANLVSSLVLWLLLVAFDEYIAQLVGSPGMGSVIAVAGVSIPLTAMSSVQMALLRRDFRFDLLFKVRAVAVFLPLLVTVPLACYGFDYWALIIGTVLTNLATAIVLLFISPYKLVFYFDAVILKGMLSFSLWSLVEAISIWLTSWADAFIIGVLLNSYYLGIYKASMTAVNTCLAIITGTTTPVLFAALSRLQNNADEYKRVFFSFQQTVALFVVPMGVGMYCYKDIIVSILLGNQWHEADLFIGLWGLSSAMTIVLGHYCSEIYRSKGMPRLSFWVQILHLLVLIPVLYWSAGYGFDKLIWARSLVRIQSIAVHFLFMYFIIKISPMRMVINILPFLGCSMLMALLSNALRSLSSSIVWDLLSIGICIVFYFGVLAIVPKYRRLFINGYQHVFQNK